jgi:hypothetical protein
MSDHGTVKRASRGPDELSCKLGSLHEAAVVSSASAQATASLQRTALTLLSQLRCATLYISV